MKKLFYAGMATILLGSCAPQSSNQFTLNGTISEADGQYIYMRMYASDSIIFADSTVVQNGNFSFKGLLDRPYAQGLIYMGDVNSWQNKQQCRLFMEPRTISVHIDRNDFTQSHIEGSISQAEDDSLNTAIKQIQQEADSLYKALDNEKDSEKAAAIRELLEPYQNRMREVQVDFVKTHPNSFISPYYTRFLMGNMTYEEIKAIYDSFSDDVKKYGDVKDIEKELATLARIQPGSIAPEIRKEDVNGDTIALSSLKGKIVLLDFWASWCVPCRKSFPHVKELYRKYHDKGLEVFCVADNDGQPDTWRKAIKEDGIEDFYHVLRGFRHYKDSNGRYQFDRSNDVSNLYAVHYLPTKYLIDREGKIIGKFNDTELDAKLKELFGK